MESPYRKTQMRSVNQMKVNMYNTYLVILHSNYKIENKSLQVYED